MTANGAAVTARGHRTCAAILAVATAELDATGRVDFTAVAERAGVAVGLLYRYFAGNDALVAGIVHQFYDRYGAAVSARRPPVDDDWFAGERRRWRTKSRSSTRSRWPPASSPPLRRAGRREGRRRTRRTPDRDGVREHRP